MARCESCGGQAGTNDEGFDNRFCDACVAALAKGDRKVITKRYLDCGHLVGDEERNSDCKTCKAVLGGASRNTYTPAIAGGHAILDDEVVKIANIAAMGAK
jgi:hypothetical protein